MPHEAILIVDYGSQYTQLIARRIREQRVYCRIIPPQNLTAELIRQERPKGIILSGGPNSVYQPNAPLPPRDIFEAGTPILGICYGMQSMAHQLGGVVQQSGHVHYQVQAVGLAPNGIGGDDYAGMESF